MINAQTRPPQAACSTTTCCGFMPSGGDRQGKRTLLTFDSIPAASITDRSSRATRESGLYENIGLITGSIRARPSRSIHVWREKTSAISLRACGSTPPNGLGRPGGTGRPAGWKRMSDASEIAGDGFHTGLTWEAGPPGRIHLQKRRPERSPRLISRPFRQTWAGSKRSRFSTERHGMQQPPGTRAGFVPGRTRPTCLAEGPHSAEEPRHCTARALGVHAPGTHFCRDRPTWGDTLCVVVETLRIRAATQSFPGRGRGVGGRPVAPSSIKIRWTVCGVHTGCGWSGELTGRWRDSPCYLDLKLRRRSIMGPRKDQLAKMRGACC